MLTKRQKTQFVIAVDQRLESNQYNFSLATKVKIEYSSIALTELEHAAPFLAVDRVRDVSVCVSPFFKAVPLVGATAIALAGCLEEILFGWFQCHPY